MVFARKSAILSSLQGSKFIIRGCSVPKYLIQASYQAAGAKRPMSEGGSKRRDAASKAISAAGGKVDAFYFAFGEHDA